MVKEMKAFTLEIVTWGLITTLSKQQTAAMWKKDVNKEGRTRIITGENFGLTLRSMFSLLNVPREEIDYTERYSVVTLEVIFTLTLYFLSQCQVPYYLCYHDKYCF